MNISRGWNYKCSCYTIGTVRRHQIQTFGQHKKFAQKTNLKRNKNVVQLQKFDLVLTGSEVLASLRFGKKIANLKTNFKGKVQKD